MTIREHIADLLHVPVYQCLDWCTFTELGADSLDMKDMCFQLETRLGITVPDEQWERCRSVGDVARVALKHLESKECTA